MSKRSEKQTGQMKTNKVNDAVPSGESSLLPTNIPTSDVFTSYIFSTSSRSLSKYGERLLMEVISVAQEYTIDAALGINKLNFGEKYSEKFAIIDIPVRNLLNEDDTTNYTKAKEAALDLMKIYHNVESPVLDDDGNQKTYRDGSPMYQFVSYHLLDKVYVNRKPGIVSVKLGEETWSQILDMGKGYTRYNLLTAKKLDDVVAIRLFQLMSNTSEPLTFSLERIKGILGLLDKYVNNPTGFIRRVIEPAEEEIREKCPFEVLHDLVYEKVARKGRPSIVGITFRKVMKATVIKDPSTVIDAHLLSILVKSFGFDERGIRSNLKLFQNLKDAGHDIEDFLVRIQSRAKEANSPQAYVIRSLQNLLDGKKPSAGLHRVEIPSPAVPAAEQSPVQDIDKPKRARGAKDRLGVSDASAFSDSELEEL